MDVYLGIQDEPPLFEIRGPNPGPLRLVVSFLAT